MSINVDSKVVYVGIHSPCMVSSGPMGELLKIGIITRGEVIVWSRPF